MIVTLEQVINAFKLVALSGNSYIQDFGYGDIWEIKTKERIYPLLWIDPNTNSNTYKNGMVQYNMDFYLFDLPFEDKSNEINIQSDLSSVAIDYVNQFVDNYNLYGFTINKGYGTNIEFQLFTEKWDDLISGIKFKLLVEVPDNGGTCGSIFSSISVTSLPGGSQINITGNGTSGTSGVSVEPVIDQDFFYDTDTDTLYVQNINTSGLTLTGETAGYVKTDDNGTVYVSVPTIDESFYYDNDSNTLYVDNINIKGLYQSSSSYTESLYLPNTINIAYIDCTDGNKYLYLPLSEGSGKTITVKKIDNTFNYVTVRPLGSELIDSVNNYKYIMMPNQSVQFHNAEVGKWYILSDYNNNVSNLRKFITSNNFGTSVVYTTYVYDYEGDGSCLLMSAIGKQGLINIIKNVSTYTLIITMSNGETLDQQTSKTLTKNEVVTIQSDGENWLII